MNKKAIYAIVGIVIVVIIIIVIFSGKSSTTSNTAPEQSAPAAPVTAAASTVRQSMQDLIAGGITKICTFSMPATGTSSSMSGTVYIDSGKMRGDFTVTSALNKTTNSHMIIASGTDYLWSDALSKGIKVSVALASSSSSQLSKQAGIDVNQPTSYTCTSEAPDQAKFMLPTDIQFTDISSYLMRSQRSSAGARTK